MGLGLHFTRFGLPAGPDSALSSISLRSLRGKEAGGDDCFPWCCFPACFRCWDSYSFGQTLEYVILHLCSCLPVPSHKAYWKKTKDFDRNDWLIPLLHTRVRPFVRSLLNAFKGSLSPVRPLFALPFSPFQSFRGCKQARSVEWSLQVNCNQFLHGVFSFKDPGKPYSMS